MKLVSYTLKHTETALRTGIVIDDAVIDVQEAHRQFLAAHLEMKFMEVEQTMLPADPAAFFALGNDVREKVLAVYEFIRNKDHTGISFPLEDVRLSSPIPHPGKVICIGKNYADHVAEMNSDIPEFPVLFAKFANAIIGPEDPIEKPAVTEKLDYEVELALVIGKKAKNVQQSKALDYIFGYTIANDTSARDLQKRTPQWLQGKTLDRSTPIGPWVVTADEIENPANLSIRSFVNGEMRQSSNTSNLIFDIPTLIAFISSIMTLEPGDIILTGTPDGVGFAMEPPQFLKAGDVVALEIEQIGRMENRIVEAKDE